MVTSVSGAEEAGLDFFFNFLAGMGEGDFSLFFCLDVNNGDFLLS